LRQVRGLKVLAQEVFGKDQKPHVALLPDDLTHRLLHFG